jgi:hypothetical protein
MNQVKKNAYGDPAADKSCHIYNILIEQYYSLAGDIVNDVEFLDKPTKFDLKPKRVELYIRNGVQFLDTNNTTTAWTTKFLSQWPIRC